MNKQYRIKKYGEGRDINYHLQERNNFFFISGPWTSIDIYDTFKDAQRELNNLNEGLYTR